MNSTSPATTASTMSNSSGPIISRRLADRDRGLANRYRRRAGRPGRLGHRGAPAGQRRERPQRDEPADADDQRAEPDPRHQRVDDQQELGLPGMGDEPVRDL